MHTWSGRILAWGSVLARLALLLFICGYLSAVSGHGVVTVTPFYKMKRFSFLIKDRMFSFCAGGRRIAPVWCVCGAGSSLSQFARVHLAFDCPRRIIDADGKREVVQLAKGLRLHRA